MNRNFALTIFGCLMAILSICGASHARSLTWGFALDGYPVTRETISQVASSTSLSPDMIVFFLQWPAPGENLTAHFPLESLSAITSIGAEPCITWEPMYIKDGREIAIMHAKITGGHYDTYIRHFAEEAREWKKPLLIRFGHEMNVKRYHWGTSEAEFGPKSPDIYKEMYRYVVDIFRKAGAGNVRWVFCANAENVPDASYDPQASWNTITAYYPGNDYVDILGIDGYNWGTTRTREAHGWQSRWMSFREIFGKPVAELKKLSSSDPAKPVIVFETSTATAGGSKQEWIASAIRESLELGIDGIVWFESDKEIDWRIESGTGKDHIRTIENARRSPAATEPDAGKAADRDQ